MFIPVTDNNPLRRIRFPYVTWGLILVNCLVFAATSLLLQKHDVAGIIAGVGLTPAHVLAHVLGASGPATADILPVPMTLVTYMFLHADIFHLVGNMVFLFVFGDNIEDATGHWRFPVLFLLCGIAGGLAHAAAYPGSTVPLIGASGATAGLVGAYLLLHPRVNIWVLVLGRLPLRLPAYWVIGAWLVWQIAFIVLNEARQVAWWAHLGGFAAGCLLILMFRRPGVPLLDRGSTPPVA